LNIKEAQREYFRACFLSIFVAIVGFIKPAAETSRLLTLVCAAIIFAAVGAYFQIWKRFERKIDVQQSKSRLLRMAFLWYVLSGVLGVALVRDPAKGLLRGEDSDVSALEWLLCAVGALVIALALFRLFKLIWERDRR
jgi:uncharacterized membrane protein YidH (DUF202 family)